MRQPRPVIDCPSCGEVPHPGRTCTGLTTDQVTEKLVELGARQFKLNMPPKQSKKGEFGW